MLTLHNSALDDPLIDVAAQAWLGADVSGTSHKLPPNMLSNGANLYAQTTGHLITRPGLRFVTLCHDGPPTTPARTTVQGVAYYDTPQIEHIVLARDGRLWGVPSDAAGVPSAVLGGSPPVLDRDAQVHFAQLIDRLHYVDNSTNLRWSRFDGGAWSHGSVTAFENGNPMPAWGGVVAHGMRLIAWPADGSRLYASAVGDASVAANWIQTENLRLGIGEGDPIVAATSSQAGLLLVFTQAAVYALDTSEPDVVNWTVRTVTRLTGCVAPRTVLAFGQEVLFLSSHGVLSLGALSDDISIHPAASLSASMQPIFDRINWQAIHRAHAASWRDHYLLALPLDDDEWPSVWLPFDVRLRQWQTPWSSPLGPIIWGEVGGASLLRADTGALFANQDEELIRTAEPVLGTVEILRPMGWCAAVVSRFGGRQETIVADSVGRLLRFDTAISRDDASPYDSQNIESWLHTAAFEFGAPDSPKQPFSVEVICEDSTAAGATLLMVPDGAVTFPDLPIRDGLQVGASFRTGTLGTFPLVFPLRFRQARQIRHKWSLRGRARFRDVSWLLHSPQGRLRVREIRAAAFIDTPTLD